MINILSKDLVNKIAAGEVVERPASVIKELMENAIDAGATKVLVRIENGGLDQISVEDNGMGIEHADLPKLFSSHATSKISTADDLNAIVTFGFRGEALASIASIADVVITTKTKKENEGSRIMSKDGEREISSYAASGGTQITVSHLFKHIPARRKFMKSEKTESSYCIRMFQEIALSHADVSFVLYKDKKLYLQYAGGSIDERINQMMKVNLLPLQTIFESQTCHIQAALTPPGSLDASVQQYIYVNNRFVHNTLIVKAVQEAYKSFLKKALRPSFVLFLTIAPDLVDVNVHPRKIEIRFLNPGEIYNIVYTACIKAFERLTVVESMYTQDSHNEEIAVHDARTDYPKKYREENPKNTQSAAQWDHTTQSALEFTKNLIAPALPITSDPDDRWRSTAFLQVGKKFIVYEQNAELVILDQHAASERVLYEKYTKVYEAKKFDYALHLFPKTLDLNEADYAYALDNKSVFASYGLVIEDLGNNMIAIPQTDNRIAIGSIEKIFFDMLQMIRDESSSPTLYEKVIASIACRSAVMFGETLSQEHMRELVTSLYACKVPFTCAHGRPVKQSLPFDVLLKKFARC